MNKVVSSFTVMMIGALLVSACAQKALAQDTSGTPQPASTSIKVSTAQPGVLSQPLSEITPQVVTPAPNAGPAGQKIVTRNDHGRTFNLAVGDTLLVQLGEGYTWEILVSDQNVFSRVKNITVINGAQGVYEALKAGTVAVTANGDPLCRQSKPACGMPSIQMEFTVDVK